MGTILPAFDLSDNDVIPPDYKQTSGYLVFDVKIDFTQKAR